MLRRPVVDVVAYLEAVREAFPIEPKTSPREVVSIETDSAGSRLEGIHAFLDDFSLPRPDRAGWIAFAARGLVRMSLGVESGSPAVRGVYGKSWADEELRGCVADLKAAGLAISLMALIGAGGLDRAEVHVRDSASLIASLDLRSGDHVFLLDEDEIQDLQASIQGLIPLERSAWAEQQKRLKEALAPLRSRGVKVLPYTLEKQWA